MKEIKAMFLLGMPFHSFLMIFLVLFWGEFLRFIHFFDFIHNIFGIEKGSSIVVNTVVVCISMFYSFVIAFVAIKVLRYEHVGKTFICALLLHIILTLIVRESFIKTSDYEFIQNTASIIYWPTCLISLIVLKMYRLKQLNKRESMEEIE